MRYLACITVLKSIFSELKGKYSEVLITLLVKCTQPSQCLCSTRNRCRYSFFYPLFRNEWRWHVTMFVFTKLSSISLQININYLFSSTVPIFIFLVHLFIRSHSNPFISFLFPFTLIHLRFVIHNNQFIGSEIKFHLR